MAFFPRSFYGSDQGFGPLFRLLEDFDNYSGGQSIQQHRHHDGHMSTFQPKFDVRETADAYELHGELAGMNKNDVRIEFTNPQTMLIGGRIERSYTARTAPTGLIEGQKTGGAITEGDGQSKPVHQATVEAGEGEASNTSRESTEVGKMEKKANDNAKYWVSERSVGEFSRIFNFPTPVEQDAVEANLKEGILSVTIPKAKKRGGQRIAIN